MSEVTLYHNPRCSKSRQTLALLEERGIEPEIIADAAMITAIRETVRALGEDQAEALVESLRGRILAGEFSPERTLQ